MAPMLPVFELLAQGGGSACLRSGAGSVLEVELVHE